ncbi:MAG: tetratricopeptide repeat protein [Janthinobacterium lividum]
MPTKSAQSISQPPSSTSRNGKSEERTGKLHRMPRTLAGIPSPVEDSGRKNLLELYEKAIRLMGTGKYSDAHTAFQQLLQGAPQDLADRIRMYIAACVAQIDKGTTEFRSHEERYDYAISLLNHGHYEDAREHFQQILLDKTDCDYAFYGLALLSSMTNSSHECLQHLAEAIRLNPQYRIQARADSDFTNMNEDPSFTELLYPEA